LYAQPLSSGHRPKRAEDQIQRATQTYLWDLSLINTLGMKVGSEKVFGVGYNVLPIWKKRLDAKTLITTPNSDVIHAMGYVDLGWRRVAGGYLDLDARRQGGQLACDGAGQGVFRRLRALRPDRSRHRQESETRRHREGALTVQRLFSDNPTGRRA
jgi:hypothetical protein